MFSRSIITAGLLLAFGSSLAGAQTAAPAAAAPTATPAPAGGAMAKPGGKTRTAQSVECSSKADTQGLHGKPRKHFMRSCKAGKS